MRETLTVAVILAGATALVLLEGPSPATSLGGPLLAAGAIAFACSRRTPIRAVGAAAALLALLVLPREASLGTAVAGSAIAASLLLRAAVQARQWLPILALLAGCAGIALAASRAASLADLAAPHALVFVAAALVLAAFFVHHARAALARAEEAPA